MARRRGFGAAAGIGELLRAAMLGRPAALLMQEGAAGFHLIDRQVDLL